MEKAAKKAEKDKIADERKQMYVLCPCALASVTKLMNQCTGVIFVRFISPPSGFRTNWTSLFLSHNTDLGPPYRILVDTNFINFSIQNKIELVQGMMDCLMAKCMFTPGNIGV